MRTLLKSKIHRAKVTGADLDYMGSITICRDLMKKADIWPGEKVLVVDVTNGNRLETYAIPGPEGSICMNGAAAHKIHEDDIIMALFDCTEVVSSATEGGFLTPKSRDEDGGLLNLHAVDQLILTMKQEQASSQRIKLVGIVATTLKDNCLLNFVQMGGGPVDS